MLRLLSFWKKPGIIPDLRLTLMATKNENENGPNSFFSFILFYFIGTRFVHFCIEKSARAFRNKITTRFGTQIRLHQRYNKISHATQLSLHLANNAARTQIHDDLYQQCGDYRKGYGRIHVDNLLKIRGRTLVVWSEVLEMLEDKEDS